MMKAGQQMKNIVVISEVSDINEAMLKKANSIAAPLNARVTMVCYTNSKNKAAEAEIELAQIKELTSEFFTDVKSVSYEKVLQKDLVTWCEKATANGKADLVIKVSQRSHELFYTPVDWKLIRKLSCPLLLCSPKKWKSKSVVFATVDVNTDSVIQNAMNESVLTTAKRWGHESHNKLYVGYVIPISRAMKELVIVEPSEVLSSKGKAVKEKVNNLLASLKIDADRVQVNAGIPAEEICSFANKAKADLVVMGSVGRKGFKGAILGNTAEKTIKNLRTDLLILKP